MEDDKKETLDVATKVIGVEMKKDIVEVPSLTNNIFFNKHANSEMNISIERYDD